MDNYKNQLPAHGRLMLKTDFKQVCKDYSMNDFDGYGHPVRNLKMDDTVKVQPSKLKDIPTDATHVLWLNRNEVR